MVIGLRALARETLLVMNGSNLKFSMENLAGLRNRKEKNLYQN